MRASLITFAHLAVSDLINAANCRGQAEQLRRHMRRGTDAAIRNDDFAGIGIGVSHEILDRFCRHTGVYHQHNGIRAHQRDWGEILDVIIGKFAEERGAGAMRADIARQYRAVFLQ